MNGQTFAPGLPITLYRHTGPVTFEMLISQDHTNIIIGTSRTVQLGADPTNSGDNAYLAFTQASNGNFVLHETTVVSGNTNHGRLMFT